MKNPVKQMGIRIVPGIAEALLTAWLFFDFSHVSLFLLLGLPFDFRRRSREEKRRQKWELNLAFKDALICLESSLAAGYSPENSLRESVKSLEQLYGKEHELCREFRRMVKQTEMGCSMEQAFLEFGKRSGVEDILQLAEIFSIVKRTGGNLGMVLRQTGGVLQEKIELKRELHTAIAAKQMEFQIMCMVPYGILFYLKAGASSMSSSLYRNTFGIVFMFGVWIVFQAMCALGRKIIRGEIGKLEGLSK